MLPPPQRVLWPELALVSHRFVLYGGTGLALRLAHRPSIDFDFFSHDPLDHRELESLSVFENASTLQEGPNVRTVLARRAGGPIKLSFFGGIAFGRVGEPELTEDGTVRVASLLDLAGTKVKALLQRVESKDYQDIDALLEDGIPLARILGAARALFGSAFNPLVARKALSYFEGGDLSKLDAAVRSRLRIEATREIDAETLPLRSSRLD